MRITHFLLFNTYKKQKKKIGQERLKITELADGREVDKKKIILVGVLIGAVAIASISVVSIMLNAPPTDLGDGDTAPPPDGG